MSPREILKMCTFHNVCKTLVNWLAENDKFRMKMETLNMDEM